MSIERRPKPWEQRDKESWEAAAAELDAQGYERVKDSYWPAMFVKDDCPNLVLVRDLGWLNWHPKER